MNTYKEFNLKDFEQSLINCNYIHTEYVETTKYLSQIHTHTFYLGDLTATIKLYGDIEGKSIDFIRKNCHSYSKNFRVLGMDDYEIFNKLFFHHIGLQGI